LGIDNVMNIKCLILLGDLAVCIDGVRDRSLLDGMGIYSRENRGGNLRDALPSDPAVSPEEDSGPVAEKDFGGSMDHALIW
jgi:hypothetical protein